jgi:hypothetical protein
VADLTLLRILPHYFQKMAHSAACQSKIGPSRSSKPTCRPPNLFLTMVLSQRIMARNTIKRWIVSFLSDAGVAGLAGSTRAAAASFALTSNITLKTVTEAADWSRSTTLFRHYIQLLPPEVLAHVAQYPARNVQDAMVNILN